MKNTRNQKSLIKRQKYKVRYVEKHNKNYINFILTN